MPMGKYIALVSQGDKSLAAIPVFPVRVFRHSAIYIGVNGRIHDPRDLRGSRIGIPEWALTAVIYARALLVHQFGVGLKEIDWVQGGLNEPGPGREGQGPDTRWGQSIGPDRQVPERNAVKRRDRRFNRGRTA